MSEMPDTDEAKAYMPARDGIVPTNLDDGTQRGRQWISRVLGIGVNEMLPDWIPDDRFYYPAVRAYILGYDDGHTPPLAPHPKLTGNGWFSRADIETVKGLRDWTHDDKGEPGEGIEIRTPSNALARVEGCMAWQGALVRHYMALYRVVNFGWTPGRIMGHHQSMNRVCFSTPNAWQRVNRKLRDDDDLKSRVEQDEGVLTAGRAMDGVINGWQAQKGLALEYLSASTEGNRFPCCKRWWTGHLESRVRADSDDRCTEAAKGERYGLALARAASRFRYAVGVVLTNVSFDYEDTDSGDE